MRAAVMHETGGPEVLRVEDAPDPELGEGEVLVRVHAASVNPIDYKSRSGAREVPLPAILGSDVSGVVERSDSASFASGDAVFGLAPGAYAELVRATPAMITPKPAGLSHAYAAALPVAGMTAWQALFDRGGLQGGQRVLIAGATGGVGHLALQLAKRAGAHAIALGSTSNRDFALSLGAADYVDYTSEQVSDVVREVDLAVDAVGGAVTATLLPTLRRGGRLVTIANAAPDQQAAERNVHAEMMVMSPNLEQLAEIAALVASGELRVEIAAELPLSEVVRAHELIESGHTRGKIVLTMAT